MTRSACLVDTFWVRDNVTRPDVAIIEVDSGGSNYETGHIPGAQKVDWQGDLRDDREADLICREAFEKLMSTLGVCNDDTLVFYSGQSNWWGAVAYWYAKIYGHREVRLLDGGRDKWISEGLALDKEIIRRPASNYVANERCEDSRVSRDDVLRAIDSHPIVDVRSPDEYTGRLVAPNGMPQTAPHRRGRIPSAVNVPWTETVNADGTFKSDSEIAAAYENAGIDLGTAPILYCRIGWRSSHSWFALNELLGAGARNYDAGWNEYGMLSRVPIERG